jgi:mono/diheme cytochrome c family protein
MNMAILHRLLQPKYLLIGIGLTLIGVAVSCSSAPASTGSGSNSDSGAPTQTMFPTYQFVAPTEAPQMATLAAATSAANTSNQTALDPDKVALGKDRYTALQCDSCHGANGEGTDKGSALTALTMSEDDFISFMRSGGKVGSSHQYNTNKLSENGGKNLYQYLLSLATK